jgi:DNA (cytosine-5)-methyltransferase 1
MLSHWDGDQYPHPTLNQSHNKGGGVGQSNQTVFSQRGAYLVPNVMTLTPMHDPNPTLDASYCKGTGERSGVERQIVATHQVSPALNTVSQRFNHGVDTTVYVFHPTQDPISSTDGSTHTLGCGSSQGQASIAVAFPLDLRNAGRDPNKRDEQNRQGIGVGKDGDPSPTLSTVFVPGVATNMAVRRLTPRECERLQGFPDDYTAIPGAADGPRYKSLGNSMAVPVMRWIGERIHKELANGVLR